MTGWQQLGFEPDGLYYKAWGNAALVQIGVPLSQ